MASGTVLVALAAVDVQGAWGSFWKRQPAGVGSHGLEVRHLLDRDVRLPPGAAFEPVDLRRPGVRRELATFLTRSYQTSSAFRIVYTQSRVWHALGGDWVPREWLLGVRMDGRLVAFAAALPRRLLLDGRAVDAAEVNYFCVDPGFRGTGLAAQVIRELARRIAAKGVRVAIYSTARDLPSPIVRCTYFHRPLRPRHLARVGFVDVPPPFMDVYARHFHLPRGEVPPGWRRLQRSDVAACRLFINKERERYRLAALFASDEELWHTLRNRRGLVSTFVARNGTGQVTALASVVLSAAVKDRSRREGKRRLLPWGPRVRAASIQAFVTTPDGPSALQVALDLSRRCRARGADVLTIVAGAGTTSFLADARFREGDGELRVHLYNYGLRRHPGLAGRGLRPEDVAYPLA